MPQSRCVAISSDGAMDGDDSNNLHHDGASSSTIISVTHTSLEEPLLTTQRVSPIHEPATRRLVDGIPIWTSILLKSLYFLEALGSSAWGRFGTIYYNLHGLNSQQIGLIEGLMPAVRAVSQPFWGYVADRYRCRKTVYLITKMGSTTILLTLALPWVYSSRIRMLVVTLSTRIFVASGILDSYTLDLLGTENKMRYGRYRMWASISWGVGTILIALITDRYGFEPNFIIFGTLGALMMALVAWRIPNVTEEQEERGDDEGSLADLIRLALRPRVLGFLLETIIMGAGMATVERLLFLYLVNDLGSSTLLCGLSVGVNVIFELPIFWYAHNFMAVLGHDGMFALSMICFVVRVYGYTLLTPSTRWLVLPLEATHGITFATFWVTSTDVTKSLINQTKGWNTTIPMAVQTLYSSVGIGIGSIVGGWAMHEFGSRDMYRCMSGIVLVLLLVHVMGSVASRYFYKIGFLPYHETVDGQENESSDDDEAGEVEGECRSCSETSSAAGSILLGNI